jgi:hypothetical protein
LIEGFLEKQQNATNAAIHPFRHVTCLKLMIPDFILIFCTKNVGNTENFNKFFGCDQWLYRLINKTNAVWEQFGNKSKI